MKYSEFAKMLRGHDWTYAWSDDGRVWRAGEATQSKIEATAKLSANHARLYELASAYYLGSSKMEEQEAAWRWVGAYLWAHGVKTDEGHAKAFCFGKSVSWQLVDQSTQECV